MKKILNFLFSFKGTVIPSTYVKFFFFLVCSWMLILFLFATVSPFFLILYFFMILSYLGFTIRFLRGQNQSFLWIGLCVFIPFIPLVTATFAYFKLEYSSDKNILFYRPMSITLIAYFLFFNSLAMLLHIIESPASIIHYIKFILYIIAGSGLLYRMNWARFLVFLILFAQICLSIYVGAPLKFQLIQDIIATIILFFLVTKKSNLYFTKK